MQNVMGIINLNGDEKLLKEITECRPLAAVPFGGRYRVIDFVLSSMVNSGIENVGILLHDKYRSIMDHLRSGKEWDLARKSDGLFILPSGQPRLPGSKLGDVDNLYHNLDYLENSRQQYVLLSGSSMVCNINYRKAFKYHQDSGADITILYKEMAENEGEQAEGMSLILDDTGRMLDMSFVSKTLGVKRMSMDMYILKRELLIEFVKECKSVGDTNLIRDGFYKNRDKLKIYGFQYKGYFANIHSLQSYYKHNMELLKVDKWQDLFMKAGLVYTKVKDEAPAKYQESAKVANTMVANGCIVGGRVENSILFRGVKVHKGAYIKDSIIMQKCEIAENAIVENVICDKDVQITAGKWLKGEKNYPLFVEKGTVV
ncbi:MAG: glucose-1-phosphate adenylyltransferase subunit GlgD [Pelosinus sp.]|nr:glucose-1-phosphate adenylyltransferase subunit GlgD [Pelosinus sp.]